MAEEPVAKARSSPIIMGFPKRERLYALTFLPAMRNIKHMEYLQIFAAQLPNPRRPRLPQLFIQEQSISDIGLLSQIPEQSA